MSHVAPPAGWATSFPQDGGYCSPDGIDFDTGVSLEGFNTDSIGGGSVDQAGTYHFAIEEAELRTKPGENSNMQYWRPSVNLRLRVLHTSPGQCPAGAIMWHELRIPLPVDSTLMTQGNNPRPRRESMMESVVAFLLGIGYLEKKEGKLVCASTGTPGFNFQTLPAQLKGRQLIGRVKHRSSPRKSDGVMMHYHEFPYGNGCSQVDDVQNANVPMNEDALKTIEKVHPRYKLPKGDGKAAATAAVAPGAAPATSAVPAATAQAATTTQNRAPGGVNLDEV